jgi:hypothetical protein
LFASALPGHSPHTSSGTNVGVLILDTPKKFHAKNDWWASCRLRPKAQDSKDDVGSSLIFYHCDVIRERQREGGTADPLSTQVSVPLTIVRIKSESKWPLKKSETFLVSAEAPKDQGWQRSIPESHPSRGTLEDYQKAPYFNQYMSTLRCFYWDNSE